MKVRKLSSAKVLIDMIEYLIMVLEELTDMPDGTQFTEGEIIAFVECLEIASQWKKYDKYGIPDIEKRFPIK